MNEATDTNGDHRWMLYGANGYTGTLIAEEAVRRGERPVLAGRNAKALEDLGARLGCEIRVCGLGDAAQLGDALSDISLVLHCAGPFTRTWEAMVHACLSTGTHYMDINGEIPVLEAQYPLHEQACARGITVLPGSGFDVVPTDCLAASLHKDMPDATHLRLAFAGKIHQSPGTWKATLEAIPRGGMIRRDGELLHIPHADRIELLQFDHGSEWCMSIPWGDIASAYRSTGIPNIEVFGGTGRGAAYVMRAMRGVTHVMRGAMLRASEAVIHSLVRGPSLRQRRNGRYHILGEVRNEAGNRIRKWMITPEGYTTTVLTALALTERILSGQVPHGVLTPSQAAGCGLLREIEGFRLIDPPMRENG
ncbi:MAG: saccharopine dehydrogenase NADP-binding domain-containing protein [Bacteroidia bacterium]|nr:saccharopine dehydrogenase NADP-binding domain-containing protein [Bacteroidia bacterium]